MCILQGPVAAKWSMVKDEPVKELLGKINNLKALIQRLLERKYGGDKSAVPTIDYLAVQSKAVPKFYPALLAQKVATWSHSNLDLNFQRLKSGFRLWLARSLIGYSPLFPLLQLFKALHMSTMLYAASSYQGLDRKL